MAHGGESTRLPPMWPGFKSRRRRHMWVEFVLKLLILPLSTAEYILSQKPFSSLQFLLYHQH